MHSDSSVDRTRALSFETNARLYDESRPGYPTEIIDLLAELAGLTSSSRILEIGCGTGKATALIARRGFAIHCIDPGETLISIARANCRPWPRVSFSVGRFEDAVLTPAAFDLVYSAQAFHWIDKGIRWKKCHQVLSPGGSIALLYNYSPLPADGTEKELVEAIHEGSGGAMVVSDHEGSITAWTDELAGTGLYVDIVVRRHRWVRRYETERYIHLLETYSDYHALEPRIRANVAERVRRLLGEAGGFTDHLYETVLFHARKGSDPA